MKENGERSLLPERFWAIWLCCLDRPRSIEEISGELEYASPSALYHKFRGKPLVDWMFEHNYLEIGKKSGRELKYKSKLENFYPKEDLWFFKKEWIRDNVFKLENIKLLFSSDRISLKECIKKLGHDFIPLVNTLILNRAIAEFVTRKIQKKKLSREVKDLIKMLKMSLERLRDSQKESYPLLNVEEYRKKVVPKISENLNDVYRFILGEGQQ